MHLNLKDALSSTVQNMEIRRIYIVTLKSETVILTLTHSHLGFSPGPRRTISYVSKTLNRCRQNTDVEGSQCGTHHSFTLVQDKT